MRNLVLTSIHTMFLFFSQCVFHDFTSAMNFTALCLWTLVLLVLRPSELDWYYIHPGSLEPPGRTQPE